MLFFGQALAWCWHYGCVWFWQGKKSFSSPFALFPANLLMLHVVIWGHVSLYTLDFNSLMMAKSECLLIPSWEQPCPCVLSQIHKWHPLAFCHFQPLKKEKGIRGEGGTRSILTAHFLQCSNLGTSYTSSSLSKQGCSHPAVKRMFVKYWGSNSEPMKDTSSGQHLQTLFCVISGFKYYIALPCQDIFSVLETGNKKNILSLGWRISLYLHWSDLTPVEFRASSF